MNARRVIIYGTLGLLLIALVIYLCPSRPRHDSGPGILGNLFHLQQAKMAWEADHPAGPEWPTKEDLNPYVAKYSPVKRIDDLRRRGSEIYIINRTGAPVYAYFPKSGFKFHDGELFQLSSNHLNLLQEYWNRGSNGQQGRSR